MALVQKKNKFARVTTWRKDGKKEIEVQCYTPHGLFVGKIWTLFSHRLGLDVERMKFVQSIPYCAKLKGAHIYLTLSYFCGPEDLPERYDLQEVANSMLVFYYENYLRHDQALLDKCAERN